MTTTPPRVSARTSPALPARPGSPWLDGADGVDVHPPLLGDLDVDVAVVGAGITGLTTAVLLHRAGVRVAVLEARHLGAAATGHTTAKLSALQGSRGATLDARHRPEVVDAYLHAHRAAVAWIADRATDVDCAFERRPAVSYATSAAGAETVRHEAAVLRRAGLPAELDADLDLPFAVTEAVRLPDQAQFDPVPYLADLARELVAAGQAVHEHTRVRSVSLLGPSVGGTPTLRTDRGRVRADHVVLATGSPLLDRGLYFARLEPARSYGQVVSVDDELPGGMYLSVDAPTTSIRTAVIDGERRLLTGGFGHRVGTGAPMSVHERALADWAAARWPVRAVTHRWSAQDYLPEDGLPFVGPMPLQSRVLVASGFAKWGMTGGTAAAMVLRDTLLGTEDPERAAWAAAFRADRVPRPSSLPTLARANGQVARYLATGWAAPDLPSAAPLAEGEGRVETTLRGKVGRCRVDGVEHVLGAVCPHLGGVLAWNDAARSWDCPLHGSRFAPDGAVLEGPVTEDLGDPPGLARVVTPRGWPAR